MVEQNEKKQNSIDLFYQDVMTPHRIMGLCDAVFAIVMTLLILDVKLPVTKQSIDDEQLVELLKIHVPDLTAFFFSFLIIGAFWIVHHIHFHHIEKSNQVLLWINVFFLMVVVLIPFTTAMVGDYYRHRLSGIIFTTNLLLVELLLFANWIYAQKADLINNDTKNLLRVKLQSRIGVINLVLFMGAVVLSVIDLHLGYLLYLAIPVIHGIYINRSLKKEMPAEKTAGDLSGIDGSDV